MVSNLQFRPLASTAWIPLKSDVRDSFYSFDTSALPDGDYVFRLTASDSESNPGEEKKSSRETSPVRIDNTPPVIRRIGSDRNPIRFEVVDSASPVTEVQYSVNAREWVTLVPDDGLSDSPKESYSITLKPGDRAAYLLVRATDASRNVAATSFDEGGGKR